MPSPRPIHLEIIVVNYKRERSAVSAANEFTSLASNAGFLTHCTICDNSGEIGQQVGSDITVMALPNPGYAAAVNAAVSSRSAHVYLILTHEVSLAGGQIEDLINAALQPGVSAVGPVLISHVGDTLLSAGKMRERGVPMHVKSVPENRWAPVDALDGACWAVSADAWDVVGPLDEGYFLYWEETDWHARAQALGLRPLLASKVRVRASPSSSPIASYYLYRNRYAYLWKHVSVRRAILAAISEALFRMPGALIRSTVRPRSSNDPRLRFRARALWDWMTGRTGPLAGTD